MTPQEKARALRPLIERAAASLSDEDALDGVELFPAWAAGVAYKADERIRYDGKLWRVRQAHTSQAQYPPSTDTASLYAEVEKPGDGDTPDNPIAYSGNMALINGKYYKQDGVVYRCFRDTINPVYNALRDLVGLYVEVVA
jgi:hypothetical protein